jgi:SAM-dependent methyltransferase
MNARRSPSAESAARVAADVTAELAKNALMTVPAVRRLRARSARTSLPPNAALLDRYALPLLRRALSVMDVRGIDVFEIGPGDNLASGLALLAAGAGSYTCADRFPGPYASPQAREWYRVIRAEWPAWLPEWPAALDVETFPEGYPEVRTLSLPIEEIHRVGQFDLVGSTSVGEHVSDIAALARATRALLRPRGVAIHHVDFAPHDCWRTRHEDPFLFLQFPGWLWRLMGSHRGTPNRFRFHHFVEAFESAGLRVSVPERCFGYAGLPVPGRLAALPPDSIATVSATFVLTRAA